MKLLELLALKMGCKYLSDLRRIPRPNDALRSETAQLPLDAFPAYEWLDAADYLCDAKCQSAENARNTILERA